MLVKQYVLLVLIFMLSACQLLKNTSYQQPVGGDLGSLFIYTPDTQQKNTSAVTVFIDSLNVGEVSENRPLQVPIAVGWHKLAVRRQSALGAKEELAKFDILIEKDIIYYVRYVKTDAPVSVSAASSTFGVVDENIGRQMQ